METLTLETSPRSVTGKKVRALRRTGISPLHLYGNDAPSMALQADSSVLHRLVAQAGQNIAVSVSVTGHTAPYLAFIREVQRHPVSDEVLHVDFYQVRMAEVMRAQVPVYLIGEAPAVRMYNGVLLQALHSVEVECLPMAVPQHIEVDVSELSELEQAIYVSQVVLNDSVTMVTNPTDLIARVNPPRVSSIGAVAEGDGAEPVADSPASEEG